MGSWIDGVFDVDSYGWYMDPNLAETLRGKPTFALPRNPWTEAQLRQGGEGWCTSHIINMLSLQRKVEMWNQVISGNIALVGQPFTDVVPGVYDCWKNEPVMVYEAEDFPSDGGDVFVKLLHACIGRPVFAPDDENKTMTREWAARTIQVLASYPSVVLDQKLCFIGQPLSQVMEGARAKLVFEDEDFNTHPCKFRDPSKVDQLRAIMVGCPVFLPDEGCEFLLARRREGKTRPVWVSDVIFLIMVTPALFDAIIAGKVPLDGQRVVDIRLELPPLAVYNEEPVELHMFKNPEERLKSYERRWISQADFSLSKPDWAVWTTDKKYFELLREMAARPELVAETPEPEAVDIRKERGFYNDKHFAVYLAVRCTYSDYLWTV